MQNKLRFIFIFRTEVSSPRVKDSTFFLISATFPQHFFLLSTLPCQRFFQPKGRAKSRIKRKSQHTKKKARVDFSLLLYSISQFSRIPSHIPNICYMNRIRCFIIIVDYLETTNNMASSIFFLPVF